MPEGQCSKPVLEACMSSEECKSLAAPDCKFEAVVRSLLAIQVPLLPAQLPKLRPQDRAARPNWHPELSDGCQATARTKAIFIA